MFSIRSRSLAGLAALLGSLTLLYGGVAFASTTQNSLPVVGSSACTDAVAADSAVSAAQAKLTALLADTSAGSQQKTDAENALADAKKAATAKLCAPAPSGTSTGTTGTSGGSTPTTTPSPSPSGTTLDKDCSDFATQAEAQSYFRDHATMSNPDPAHLDANGNGVACEDEADGSGKVVTGRALAPTTVRPSSRASVPDSTSSLPISGGQVSSVPDTSSGVDTGGWE